VEVARKEVGNSVLFNRKEVSLLRKKEGGGRPLSREEKGGKGGNRPPVHCRPRGRGYEGRGCRFLPETDGEGGKEEKLISPLREKGYALFLSKNRKRGGTREGGFYPVLRGKKGGEREGKGKMFPPNEKGRKVSHTAAVFSFKREEREEKKVFQCDATSGEEEEDGASLTYGEEEEKSVLLVHELKMEPLRREFRIETTWKEEGQKKGEYGW